MESLNFVAALVALNRGAIDVPAFLRASRDGELCDDGAFLSQLQELRGEAVAQEAATEAKHLLTGSPGGESGRETVAYQPSQETDSQPRTDGTSTSMVRSRRKKIVGHGGFGQVWLADDLELSRQVALKETRSQVGEQNRPGDAIASEARLIGRLEHPSIVPVHGLGKDASGQSCYAMRFIPDKTMSRAIADFHGTARTDPEAPTLQLRLLKSFTDICNAAHCAHTRGVVHRDIKPANIVLGDLGEAYLIDWGLAASVSSERSQVEKPGAVPETRDGGVEIVGTPFYMSPEQARGEPPSVAADVFSLGATLYEVLTRCAPYQPDSSNAAQLRGSPMALLHRVQSGDFIPLKERASGIGDALAQICAKAMAPDPSDRFATAKGLTEAIESYFVDLPIRHWNKAVQHFTALHREYANDPEFGISLAKSSHALGVANWGLRRTGPRPPRPRRKKNRRRSLIPFTVLEVRRLLRQIAWPTLHKPDAAFNRFQWRSRHQADAKKYHDRNRDHPKPG